MEQNSRFICLYIQKPDSFAKPGIPHSRESENNEDKTYGTHIIAGIHGDRRRGRRG